MRLDRWHCCILARNVCIENSGIARGEYTFRVELRSIARTPPILKRLVRSYAPHEGKDWGVISPAQMKAKEMAEEEQIPTRFPDITDPSIPDYYAHLVNVSMAKSDVVLCFGRQLEALDGSVTTNQLVRITVTHDNFMKMANYIAGFGNFLTSVYSDHLPSLEAAQKTDPKRFQEAAFQSLGIGTLPEETAEEVSAEE